MSGRNGLTQKAYEYIKEKIVKCEFMPETDISEDILMKDIGISRTPIREALLRLEHEKLISIIPRKAIFVSNISMSIINEVFQIRELIEAQVLRLVGNRLSKAWLEEIKIRFTAKPDTEDELWYHVNLDKEFHSHLIDLYRNSYLTQLMNNVFDQNQRLRVLSFKSSDRFVSSDAEHIDIIDALLMDDIDRAEECMKKHIQSSRNVALNINIQKL